VDAPPSARLQGARNPARCPYCHDPCGPAEAQVVCQACLARHHAACWDELARCGACGGARGLGEVAPPPPDRRAVLARLPRGRRALARAFQGLALFCLGMAVVTLALPWLVLGADDRALLFAGRFLGFTRILPIALAWLALGAACRRSLRLVLLDAWPPRLVLLDAWPREEARDAAEEPKAAAPLPAKGAGLEAEPAKASLPRAREAAD